MNWKYVNQEQTIVHYVEDGVSHCFSVETEEAKNYLASGGVIDPYEPPVVDPKVAALSALQASDSEMARVAEDLYTALLKAGILKEEDFPKATVAKIKDRINLRVSMNKK